MSDMSDMNSAPPLLLLIPLSCRDPQKRYYRMSAEILNSAMVVPPPPPPLPLLLLPCITRTVPSMCVEMRPPEGLCSHKLYCMS
jgi:hypothetical protein